MTDRHDATTAVPPHGERPRVVLGVSGGIAAYKACELLRRLTESGHGVRVVPTASALHFVGAATWSALSGNPVSTEVWDDVHEVPHVRIGQHADLVVVAPATADTLARAAHGLADDLLTNTLPTARCPGVPPHPPPDGPLPGRLRPRHAHRDVGAPGHPGERADTASSGRDRDRARRRPSDRRRHRQGPTAGTRRDLRGLPPGAGPGRPRARPQGPARGRERRRHP